MSKFIVKEKRLYRFGFYEEFCCKSFAKTKNISKIAHHYNKFKYLEKLDYTNYGDNKQFSENLSDNKMMYINHYIGSYKYYFENKVPRGSCNKYKLMENSKSKAYEYINLNEITDSILDDQNKK